ncbi:hypothetical protein OHA25_60130 (plasmid) [Nonomuraea sp. NBC_00507]|uniref:hypothetical protein n=1 Tax=Nonomuraea sp. NBC_00507 TaxID=2976002 RepID=UPI002E16F79B
MFAAKGSDLPSAAGEPDTNDRQGSHHPADIAPSRLGPPAGQPPHLLHAEQLRAWSKAMLNRFV